MAIDRIDLQMSTWDKIEELYWMESWVLMEKEEGVINACKSWWPFKDAPMGGEPSMQFDQASLATSSGVPMEERRKAALSTPVA